MKPRIDRSRGITTLWESVLLFAGLSTLKVLKKALVAFVVEMVQ